MQKSDRYCIIITTTDSVELTEKISNALVAKNLGACVQSLAISSVYKWKGDVAKDDETLLLIKTRASLIDDVERLIVELHTYETPEIICVPIMAGSAGYTKWIDDETGA